MKHTLGLEQYPSDFTYFHSDYIINIWKKYNFTEFYATSHNSYVCERLDYKNPNKGNNIIFYKKSDTEDSKVGFITDMHNRTNMFPLGMPYRHFLFEGDIWLSEMNMNVEFCKLTDNSRGNTFRHSLAITNGCLETVKLEIHKWYHIRIYFDCENLCSYLELDGNIICRKEIEQYFVAPTFYEFSVCSGIGEVRIREWEITGLSRPAIIEQNTFLVSHTSQFPDESKIRDYLTDKVIFNGDRNVVYFNNSKIPLGNSRYIENDLYVDAKIFNRVFGTCINGEVAVRKKSKELGYYAKTSGYGKMIIISKKDDMVETSEDDFPWFDNQYYSENLMTYPILSFSDAQEISNFIFFERPDKEQIKKDFYSRIGASSTTRSRVHINQEKLEEIKKKIKADKKLEEKINTFLQEIDKLLDNPSVEYKYDDPMRTLWNCWNNFSYISDVAFAYALTEDKRYSEKVIKELLNVSEFPDLNPCHIIDMGQWLYTLAVGYDWCYDAMSDSERKKISEFIIEKGIKVLNRAFYGRLPSGGLGEDFQLANWFVRWKSNYISFVFAGLIPAALVVFEKAEDLCADTISKALRSFEYMLYGLYPDGIWLEGKTYMNMVYWGIAKAGCAMDICLGNTYGLFEYPGVKEGLETYIQYDSMVSGFTFGDDGDSAPFSAAKPYINYFSEVYNNDLLSAWRSLSLKEYERQHRYKIKRILMHDKNADVDENISIKPNISIYDILYHKNTNFNIQNKKVHYAKGGEIFSYHEDILDENALVLVAAGGPTRHYHFHNDGGDFMLCKNGELWTWEFGQGDYNVGTIFTRFSGRSEAHNTLTINPGAEMSQKLQAFAPITNYGEKTNGAYAIIDMTELYAHHGAESLFRRFDIENDTVMICDTMEFNEKVKGYWIMHTPAKAEFIDKNTINLYQNGKALKLSISIDGCQKQKLSITKSGSLPEFLTVDADIVSKYDVNSIRLYFEGVGKIQITAKME